MIVESQDAKKRKKTGAEASTPQKRTKIEDVGKQKPKEPTGPPPGWSNKGEGKKAWWQSPREERCVISAKSADMPHRIVFICTRLPNSWAARSHRHGCARSKGSNYSASFATSRESQRVVSLAGAATRGKSVGTARR